MDRGWSRAEIESLASGRSFARGLAYHHEGRVEIGARGEDLVRAIVRGSMPYQVELGVADDLSWSCTCPVGESGEFCKHCVAVALEIADTPPLIEASRLSGEKRDPDLRSYLSSLDPEALIELLMEQTESDWRLRERFTAAAITAGGGSLDVRGWTDRIDAAFGGHGFVSYAEASGWARDVFEVLAALDDLVDVGHGVVVVRLAEHAHRRAEAAIQHVDDSDGCLTDISERIAEIHLRACEVAGSDPVGLARRLAELELTTELDTFRRAAATYAEVLGPEGVAEYRRIIEPKWRKTKDNKDRYSHDVFATTQAMIGVAQAGGDPDDLIAIRAGDLRTPDDYLEIATSLAAAGRVDDAIDWSQRGLHTFADRHWQTHALREFLAAQFRARGDKATAEQLWWQAFERHPTIDAYRKLLAETADHEARKHQAIQSLFNRLSGGDSAAASAANPILERSPATTLVEILLYEGNVDDAWHAAVTYGCDDRTWMTLARARESTHPLDAIPIYERALAAQIEAKKKTRYRAAVELLARIENLAAKAGEPQRFTDVLAAVMTEHARKSSLMALIDKQGFLAREWPGSDSVCTP